ncbi:hypothetical protein VHEMI10710 [[Torrubiella] hemipterigena]|uniref:RNase H type-1 domain-containing protein n=1 Tax=[Torrubiella] hemipterigena TaxID=1531966 RepID=A0A0A1TSD4_9HYPO|nr:hypothetical protein VHEMI10710 [[Torrubiella] hemipterigena]
MILPVWKTTPKEYLWKEVGILPAELLVKSIRSRVSLRLATLDRKHPLRRRLDHAARRDILSNNPDASAAATSRRVRLVHTAQEHKDYQEVVLIPRRYSTNIQVHDEQIGKDQATAAHLQWLNTKPSGYIIYSDGSKLENGSAGYGFVVYYKDRILKQKAQQLGTHEVFNAEVTGAFYSLKAILKDNSDNLPITICIDNLAVVRGISSTAPTSSKDYLLKIQALGDKYPGHITVRWTPRHKDIPGNEKADKLAKEGESLQVRMIALSISQTQREVRQLPR